jgi:putative oxidoreductase
MLKQIIQTNRHVAPLIIRLMIGAVFLSEGIQKFLYPAELGAGRFQKIGLPNPEFLAPFVGFFEIACGILVILGFVTRLAVIPLLIISSTAILTTKVPMLLQKGFWPAAHEIRVDYCMWLGAFFLFVTGAGSLSVDARIVKPRRRTSKTMMP